MESGIMDKLDLFAERMPTNGLAARLPHRERTVAEVEAQPDAGYGMIGQSRSMIHSSYVHPRILYVIGQLGIGGYERQLYNLLQALDRPCYKPVVVVWGATRVKSYETNIRALGVAVHSFPDDLSRGAKLMALRRLVRELSPELVHSYSFYTNFPAWWATLGTGSIAVGSIRNNFTSEILAAGGILGRLSARWPSIQICNSASAKRAAEEAMGPFKPARIHVVPNGMDIHGFKAISPLPAKPALLAVGRLYPQKRWDRLVNILALVQQRGLCFSIRHAGEGPLRPALESQARCLAVDHLLEFLGERHDVADLLAASTCLVHTADEEGCPNVVMEAMACGRAVVATDAGHSPQLIEDGTTGFVVKRGDDQTFAERVAMLIEDPDLARRMGLAGRAKIECEFGLRQLLDRTFLAYREAGWRG
jgi:glycosyltransferase involved in cell wall biosynthesis